jgi:flagellar hook-associated protein 3 FlgL
MTDKISRNEEINSTGSVNDSGFRKILYALTLSVDGGVERMNSETRQVLVNRVYSVASEASYELVHTQSVAGIAQERLARANERIEIQQTSVKRSIGEAEGVDSYEVADRLGLLMSRIEASYSVTGRLQQLTLLNYL